MKTELESKVIQVGRKRVKLTVCIDYCDARFFSMENLSNEQIDLLRKSLGKKIKATIERDPWNPQSRCYWKLLEVEPI